MSRVTIQTVYGATTKHHLNNGSSTADDSTEGGTVVASKKTLTRSDIKITKRDSGGFRQPTPYSCTVVDRVEWNGFLKRTQFLNRTLPSHWEDIYEYSGVIPVNSLGLDYPSLPASGTFPAWLVAAATTECLLKVKDQQVQYAVAIAEASKSAALIAHNVQTLNKAFRYVRKGKFREAIDALGVGAGDLLIARRRPRTSKEVSSRWLELQYGWLPLLSDIHGAYEDIRKGFLREPRISATKQKVLKKEFFISSASGVANLLAATTGSHEYRVRVRLDYTVNIALLQKLASKGLTNPLEVAWELVPYSFVVDWFLPIGDFLSALDATAGLTFKSGSVTTTVITDGVTSAVPIQSNINYRTEANMSCASRKFTMDRKLLTSNPGGSLYFKTPLSVLHALNALALLRVRFK